MLAEVDDIPLSPVLRDIFLSSENGPELAYELAKNRDEFKRVCALPPLAAAREMGKLESRLEPKSPSAALASTKTTKAPKPLDPVGTSGKGSAKKSLSDPGLSQKEYEELRAPQRAARRAQGR